MALTELQLPSKDLFYSELQDAATQMNRLMGTWSDLAEFISTVENVDLDSMGVATTGTVRTDLVNFRTAIEEFLAFFNGTATTQTVTPSDVIDKIRRMR